MTISKSTKINMYKFVNTNSDSGGDVDPVAKSLNVQTQALNNMGRTINGIASTVVALKNIALHRLNEDINCLNKLSWHATIFFPSHYWQPIMWRRRLGKVSASAIGPHRS